MKTLKVLLQEVVSGIKAWVNSNFAQESNTVHKTGNETVNGDKYLTGYFRHTLTYDCIQSTAFDVRTDPEANRGRDIFRFWDGDRSSLGDYLGGMSYYQETDGSSRLQLICFGYPTTGNASQQRINFHAYRDGTGSFYPVINNVNLGTSAYPWVSIYAQNYYYKGTQWGLDKANTWTGNNRFQALSISSANTIDITQSTLSSATTSANFSFNDNGGRYWGAIRTQVQTDRSNILKFIVSNWKTNGTQGITELDFFYDANLDKKSFYPTGVNVDLGTSTNKWKSFNGVNPGLLSIPNMAVSAADIVDISSWYIQDPDDPDNPNAKIIDDSVEHTVSSDVPGWVCITIPNVAGNFAYARQSSSGGNMCDCRVANGLADDIITIIYLVFPIIDNLQVRIRAKSAVVRIFPCLGNV